VGSLLAQQSGARSIDLSWTAPSDNVGVAYYQVTMDGAPLADTTATGVSGIAAADGLTHDFSVVAVDGAGNLGPEATTQLTLPDVTAPGAPGSLLAKATGPTSVALTWSAASDNIGVTGYRLTRDGGFVANVAATATAFIDSGVPSDHTYTYALTAIDAAGNEGPGVSGSVTLVSVDVVAPAAPTGLKASAIGGRRVSLTWLASTDDRPGTIRYKVFRGTRRIAVVTTLGYVDRPASVGWYRYRVKAVDAAGNVSVYTAWVRVYAKR
jgi:chitodextrinase